ncbi:MAG: hypothetical protein ACR2MG_17495 [Pyrinomonadaceae bacterium]
MENETEKQKIENHQPVNYGEKVEKQKDVVKKLEDSHKKNPSDDLELELSRETDLLRHYTNAAQGNPKERAKKTAEIAKKITLNRAVQQVSPEQ